MPEESDLLSALPRTRPHRRSGKRPARAPATPVTPSEVAGAKPTVAAKPRAAAKARSAAKPRSAAKRTAAKPGADAKLSAANKAPAARARATEPAARPSSIEDAPRARARIRTASQPLRQPAQPPGAPTRLAPSKPVPPNSRNVLGTAVQAAAELAEIGVVLSARAVRNAVSRVPRP
jgi:hypothetical protein